MPGMSLGLRLIIYGLGIVYEATMIGIGTAAYLTAKAEGNRSLRVLGLGFLLIGIGDLMHTLGHVAMDVAPFLRLAYVFEVFSTALSITLATAFFTTVRLYVNLARKEDLGPLDKALLCFPIATAVLAFVGAGVRLLPVFCTLMLYMALLASSVILMVIAGYVGCLSLLRAVRMGLLPTGPGADRRRGRLAWGSVLMALAVTFVLIHPFVVHAPLAMFVITVLKILTLMSSGLLVSSSLMAPRGSSLSAPQPSK
ncbi:hypothetical protein B6U66_04480 [Candidatus Bathyarchaeota archaeon ex4484_135]|nr:MAG: hypothetical protein B6U66_04480 [Candidatus Bathyarchaeota archaeon ex4484_135]